MKAFLLVFPFPARCMRFRWTGRHGQKSTALSRIRQGVVPVSILAFLLLGAGIPVRLFGGWLQATFSATLLRQRSFGSGGRSISPGSVRIEEQRFIGDSLAWKRSRIMGLAWLGNLAFNSIDMLMLE